MKVNRQTVDLSEFPDLIVVYLGMRVRSPKGIRRFIQLGREIAASVAHQPNGLLAHESRLFSLFPPHAGMRQYWRDFESLERWTRSLPHQQWWQDFLRDPSGTGFWHETYSMRGGIEAIYDDMDTPIGLMRFAPRKTARGTMFSARDRLALRGEGLPPVVEEPPG